MLQGLALSIIHHLGYKDIYGAIRHPSIKNSAGVERIMMHRMFSYL